VAGLVLLTAALMSAQVKPKVTHTNVRVNRGSVVVFTNFEGAYPFWKTYTSWDVSGPETVWNAVMAVGFTPSSDVTFSDVAVAMGVCHPEPNCGGGGARPYRRVKIYLESDAAGLPGSILDGPLTQLYPIRDLLNFKGGGVNQFDCVTCPVLSAGTRYWVVAQQDKPHVEDGWDQSFSDSAWEFAYNLEGSATGPWTLMGSGYIRPAFQVDGN
jgi:hypothetical protein